MTIATPPAASSAASTPTADPEALLRRVTRAIDAIVVASEPHHGLFTSLLDRRTGAMLRDLPPGIPGQRIGDRSHLGSNLIHDEALLATLLALGDALARPDYTRAAGRYLARFATHCTDTATGLFPWGEHAYWHLPEDRVGNSYALREGSTTRTTHDHLRQAPLWLWEKLWSLNPRCVERFAEGLDFHWKTGEPSEYTRHAYIEVREHPTHAARACDFPRHSGFYVLDWSFAYLHTRRADFVNQIHRMLDHWWTKRGPEGQLFSESRSPEGDVHHRAVSPGQTLSLAASLHESANLLEHDLPDLAATMRHQAATYVEGFFAAPHDLDRGVFVLMCGLDPSDVRRTMLIWGSVYGVWPASYVALTALCVHRLTRDSRLLEWATAVATRYAAEPIPADVQAPAMDAGLGIALLADLFDITRDRTWMDAALRLAAQVIPIYWDTPSVSFSDPASPPIPRGAAGIDFYESQMGPGFLLHALARTALLAQSDGPCLLPADCTAR